MILLNYELNASSGRNCSAQQKPPLDPGSLATFSHVLSWIQTWTEERNSKQLEGAPQLTQQKG